VRRIALILTLFMMLPALGLETNAESYEKGDSIIAIIEGLAIGGSYQLTGYYQNNVVFISEFTASSESYNHTYDTSFLNPSGEWVLALTGPGVDENTSVIVNPTRDSSSYLVSFINPVSRVYERTTSFNIQVNVTSAGEIITNATVQSFNPKGEVINLTEEGEGIYSAPFSLAIDALTGTKSISVMVIKDGLGGQGTVNITVDAAKINVTLLQPKLNAYDIGSRMTVDVLATYPNGSIATTNLTASYNDKPITLELIDDHYIGYHDLAPEDDGLATLVISSEDDYGNSGLVSKKITGGGLIKYYLLSNIYFIIAGIAGIAVASYLANKKVSASTSLKKLKEQKIELSNKKKRLQEDYFVNSSINKNVFEEETGVIDEKLNVIEGKLRDYKKKKKKDKKKS